MKPLSNEPSKVLIFLSAKNLANKDHGSKSDPIAKVYYKFNQDDEIYIGETESIQNDLNPTWKKSFELDYNPNSEQQLRVVVLDVDPKDKDDIIGSAEVTLQQIMQNSSDGIEIQLVQNDKEYGTLIINADKVIESTQQQYTKKSNDPVLNDEKVQKLTQFLDNTGLESAFKLIYAEILTKNIHQNDVYTYTAVRLRQIGSDLKQFFQQQQNNEKILGEIKEE